MQIINDDCLHAMSSMEDNSIDLVFTSPPYAEKRKSTYGGIPADQYVDWFLPIAHQIKRVMKPTASFFLNIKAGTVKGSRETYVIELVLEILKQTNMFWVDEFVWGKMSPFPGQYFGKFKNAHEPVYHFSKSKPSLLKFNPEACGTPVKPGSIARAYRKQSGAPANLSGMTAMNTLNLRKTDRVVRPSNLLIIENISNQNTPEKSMHPATFPIKLPEFFIKSFTNVGDVVLDPFAGIGTTGKSALSLGRDCILIEKESKYCEIMSGYLSKS